MPGLNSDEVRVWAGAVVYAGPFGTAMPADPTIAPAAAFIHMGEITEDGIEFASDPSFNNVVGYNQAHPHRRVPTGEDITVSVSVLQWNADNHKIVNGGGTITQIVGPPAHRKYEPPTLDARASNFKAVILHMSDGTGIIRRCIPKALVTSGGGFTTEKGDGSPIRVDFGIIQPAVGSAWYDLIMGLDTTGYPAS